MRAARIMSIGAALLLAQLGCGPSETTPPPEYAPIEEPEPTTFAEPEPEPEPEPEAPPPPPVQVVAGERTPIEGRAPTLRILAPTKNQLVRRGNVQVRIQLRNWQLAPDPGNHVHVIVDNEPYMAIRDVARPLNLNALVQEHLGHELESGTHVVRVFPSRPHHESVKEGTPFAMAVFSYQERSEDWQFDTAAPLLTYSRPKGCNRAGERVLLDFYVTNAELGDGDDQHKVKYTIDGNVTGTITQWAPHYIENLLPGEHRVRLQLIGPDGQPAAGMFNDTTRNITVAPECPGDQPAAQDEEED